MRTKCVTYRYLLGVLQFWKCTVWETICNSNFPISLPCRNRNLSHGAMQSWCSCLQNPVPWNQIPSFLQVTKFNQKGRQGTLKWHFFLTHFHWLNSVLFFSPRERLSLGNNNENNKNHINRKSINNTDEQACGCSPFFPPCPKAVRAAESQCFLMQELIAASVYFAKRTKTRYKLKKKKQPTCINRQMSLLTSLVCS